MRILAIDLGKFKSVSCRFDSESDPAQFIALLEEHPVDLVVFEACSMAGWVSDLCQQLGLTVLVASPLEDAWSWKNVKRKTDRDDALKLAKLAALKQITPAHIPSPPNRQLRSLIVFRKRLVGNMTRVKNHIRRTMGLARVVNGQRSSRLVTWTLSSLLCWQGNSAVSTPSSDRSVRRNHRSVCCQQSRASVQSPRPPRSRTIERFLQPNTFTTDSTTIDL